MKNLAFAVACLLISCTIFGQDQSNKKWKVRALGITSGSDMDMLKKLDKDWLLNSSQSPVTMDLSQAPITDESLYEMICENPRLSLSVSLTPPHSDRHELRLEGSFIFDRIDQVEYRDERVLEDGSMSDESLLLKAIGNEIALGASYLVKTNPENTVVFSLGLGTNAGYTFGGDLYIDSRNRPMQDNIGDNIPDTPYKSNAFQHYKQNNGYAQRLFLHIGLDFKVMKDLELGIELKPGGGYRHIDGAGTSSTEVHSAGFTLRYILK